MNGLGKAWRDAGQRREPAPPASTTESKRIIFGVCVEGIILPTRLFGKFKQNRKRSPWRKHTRNHDLASPFKKFGNSAHQVSRFQALAAVTSAWHGHLA
jgi:hypothetical protein